MISPKQRAALLVAAGKLSEPEIAAACGTSERSLRRWKRESDFRAEVARQQKERRTRLDKWRDRVIDIDIADQAKRVERLDADQKALDQIREERGAHADLSKLPGGKTGLVIITGIRKVKIKAKDAKGNEVVREQALLIHETDTALLAESRALAEQAARELGERSEKHELTGADGGAITIELMDAILRRHSAGNSGPAGDKH